MEVELQPTFGRREEDSVATCDQTEEQPARLAIEVAERSTVAAMSALKVTALESSNALQALLNKKALVPQQALGAINVVVEVVNRVLANLNDPEQLAKFRRVKISALRKKLAQAPNEAEAILHAAGFTQKGEHLEWGEDEDTSLVMSLTVLALAARVQEEAHTSGLRALGASLSTALQPVDVLSLTFGNVQFHELQGRSGAAHKAADVGGALVNRSRMREMFPQLLRVREEHAALFELNARSKAAANIVSRAVTDARRTHGLGDAAKLRTSSILGELAQLAAGVALVGLRAPSLVDELVSDELLRKCSSPNILPPQFGAGSAGQLVPALLSCVPMFRLGLPHGTLSHILDMREMPGFFTAGVRDKLFEISLSSFSEVVLTTWLSNATTSALLLWPEIHTIGVSCAFDVEDDDKAIIFAIFA